MPVRIERIDKEGNRWVVTGNNESELKLGISALHAALDHREEVAPLPQIGRPPKHGISVAERDKQERLRTSLQLLSAINDAGEAGADSSTLLHAAELEKSGPQALGPAIRRLNGVLQEYQLLDSKVYKTTGISPNKRWVPQAEIQNAIKKLEETMKVHQH